MVLRSQSPNRKLVTYPNLVHHFYIENDDDDEVVHHVIIEVYVTTVVAIKYIQNE